MRRVIPEAEAFDLGVLEAARLAWLRQVVSGDVWVEAGATRTFVEIAQRMRDGGDPDLALRSLAPIAHRCWWTRTRTTTRQYLADAATGMGLDEGDPRGLACARPLLATDEQAEALFVAALAHDLTGCPFLGARTCFSFGRWLRRQRRTAESRAPLRESVALFDALGATVWSRRARQELRATGERIGRRAPDLRDRLTAQELQIAQLAAEGLSNLEIGERLFLSPARSAATCIECLPSWRSPLGRSCETP